LAQEEARPLSNSTQFLRSFDLGAFTVLSHVDVTDDGHDAPHARLEADGLRHHEREVPRSLGNVSKILWKNEALPGREAHRRVRNWL